MSDVPQRRLAAIVAIDVVGYSLLMGADESGTLARLKGHRAAIDPINEKHGGRIVGTAGDGLLLEFPSVIEAVTSAIEVQGLIAERNSTLPDEQKMLYRIGINLGDVMVDDEDIYGDGVNVAARIEALAKPGGISVSRTVRDSVRDRMDIGLEDMGEFEVKNIVRPVRVFRVLGEGEVTATPTSGLTAQMFPLPDTPSIAVLPFDNMSGDPEQEYFADGITEDIITALSRFHQFFVIARNSSFTYKGSVVDVKQVADELGVQYVIEGSVRRAGNRVRITAQLIDAASSTHIWAERYDRDLDDIFAVQDDITERVAMAVGPELDSREITRIRRKDLPELGAWELLARANWHGLKLTEKDICVAEELLFKVLELDPKNSRAHGLLSGCYATDALYGWRRPTAESRALALEMGQIAVSLDKEDEFAHARLGVSLFVSKRHEEAAQRFRTAIKLNPNSSRTLGFLGVVLVFMHKHAEAVELLHRVIQLSPKDPMLPFYISNIGFHHFIEGRYDEARMWAEKALHENPNFPTAFRLMASAHGMLSDLEEARAAHEQFDHLAPGVTIAATLEAVPFAYEDDAERFAEGLRRAGMPE